MTHSCTTSQSSTSRLLYDRREGARQLSVSIRSLDYFIARKLIGTRRIGKKVLIPHAELVRFAAANHYEPVTPAPDSNDSPCGARPGGLCSLVSPKGQAPGG
jgi:hypothetical protein